MEFDNDGAACGEDEVELRLIFPLESAVAAGGTTGAGGLSFMVGRPANGSSSGTGALTGDCTKLVG